MCCVVLCDVAWFFPCDPFALVHSGYMWCVVWCRVVLCCVVWCGVVSCCVVWCGLVPCYVGFLFISCDPFALVHSGSKAGGGKTLGLSTFEFEIVIVLCCGVLRGVRLCCVVLSRAVVLYCVVWLFPGGSSHVLSFLRFLPYPKSGADRAKGQHNMTQRST